MTRPYILFHAVGATDETFFSPVSRDNCAEPFIAFRERCRRLGYKVEATRDQLLEECEWIVFWDVYSLGPINLRDYAAEVAKKVLRRGRRLRNVYREALASARPPKMALAVMEPPSITKKNLRTSAHERMDVVFTWNQEWIRRGGKYVSILLPVTDEFPEVEKIPFGEKKLLVDISANKSSRHPAELYSARREAIGFFQKRLPDGFDLYGVGWDREHYPLYRGMVEHKWDVMPRYRFVICYENGVFPDYISQRVFDVLRCNTVPVYWGATNVEEYIDSGAFVDRRRFSSNEELAEYLTSVSEAEYEAMLAAGRGYLQSERFRRFLGSSWGDTLESAMGLKAR
ncbi:MAG TPA: glycosyltransferase family 10 [Thermoanaerobaculia bacterium]